MPLAHGAVFAGYTVVRALGSGGMGEVYLVEHPRLPRRDALKVLPAVLTADHEYRERFNREADIVAKLWHPHIVAVHDRGESDGQLWLTMDFVEGTDAGHLLQSYHGKGLPPADVVGIVSAVADALDYAHQRQLLHRDVKPSNILLSELDAGQQRIVLADFGIARLVDDSAGLTATDMTVGTVAYAAPEQLMGEVIDGRADQYALAATAFHLLTGQQPFQHTNPAVVISQHLTAPPPAIADRVPELSSLGPVFSKALAKKAEDRYGSCVEFAQALQQNLNVISDELAIHGDGGGCVPRLVVFCPATSSSSSGTARVGAAVRRGRHVEPAPASVAVLRDAITGTSVDPLRGAGVQPLGPGQLKNALVGRRGRSRPDRLRNKRWPSSALAWEPSSRQVAGGAARGARGDRRPCVDAGVAVGRAHQRFGPAGGFADESLRQGLAEVVEALVAVTRARELVAA